MAFLRSWRKKLFPPPRRAKLTPKDHLSRPRCLWQAIQIVKRKGMWQAMPEWSPDEIEKEAVKVLMRLLEERVYPSVRFNAAKELIRIVNEGRYGRKKAGLSGGGEDEALLNEEDELNAALADARILLAEIAEAKSGRMGEPGEVDQGGAAGATDPEG